MYVIFCFDQWYDQGIARDGSQNLERSAKGQEQKEQQQQQQQPQKRKQQQQQQKQKQCSVNVRAQPYLGTSDLHNDQLEKELLLLEWSDTTGISNCLGGMG